MGNMRRLTRVALLAAALCVMAPFSLPVGPVPLTLATLGVYLAAALLGPAEGTAAVALYVLLGALGVPVFSGFTGGVQRLAGVTGGYIVGYILCAAVVGLLWRRLDKAWRLALALVCGTAVLYAFGTAWYVAQTGTPLWSALLLCVAPFLPGDAAKIIVICGGVPPLKKTLIRRGLLPPNREQTV